MKSVIAGMLLAMLATADAGAAGATKTLPPGAVERLVQQTGVYNVSRTGKTPGFVVDAAWPQTLPHNWLLGQIGGLYVDSHDHVWVLNRPRTLTNDEAGLEKAVPGERTAAGVPVNGLGFERARRPRRRLLHRHPLGAGIRYGRQAAARLGRPCRSRLAAGHCKAADGCIWPNNEHGIYVDGPGQCLAGR